jgi:hypothetical protein
MKKISVRFYQAGNEYQFETEVKNDNLNLVVGTALNQLTRFMNVAKKCQAKVFNLKNPVTLQVAIDGKVFDNGTANEKLTVKLKLQRSNKGYKRFAVRTFEIVKFSISPIEAISLQDYLKSLE